MVFYKKRKLHLLSQTQLETEGVSLLTGAVHLSDFAKPKYHQGLRILHESGAGHFLAPLKKLAAHKRQHNFLPSETEGFEPSVLVTGRLVSSEVL